MSAFVADASVVIKWFVPEVGTPHAIRLRDGGHDLHSPTFVEVEVANTIWKKLLRGEITRAEADDILLKLLALPLHRHLDCTLVASAFDLADQTKRTVYECLYLALAIHVQGRLVTADDRFINSLAGTPWAGFVIRLADVP